ncbi:MAG: lamin tail domain-containing protein [bacterium]|nr:lamin tail domain-containing protein [bacterium]
MLSEKDTKLIVNEIQKELSRIGGTIDILKYSSQQQAALTLLRSSARDIVLRFLPAFVATETIKVVFNLVSSLEKVSEVTIKEILDEIEKQTVEKAVAIGNAWLFQNEIKTGSGTIKHPKSGGNFQYVLIYKSTAESKADIIFEFYSPEQVDSPSFQGSMGTFSGSLGDSAYIGKVNPFVIHIETKVEKIGLGWVVDSSADTKITVEFPDKVPVLQLAKELPYPLEEQKIKLLNYWNTAKNILEYLRSLGSEAIGKTADFVYKAQEVVKSLITNTSQLFSKAGAGLVDPFSKESQQIDFIEAQLNQVKDVLDAKENEVKLSLAKDAKDEASPVENLIPLSFPQEQPILSPVESNIEEDELKLNEIKDEVREEPIPQVVVPELNQKLNEIKDKVKLSPTKFCAIDPTRGPALSSVILYEIAWMGSANSANDEYIKLKNISNSAVNLEGWQLQDKDNQIQIVFEKEHGILFQEIFVLERTNDDSLPGTQAHIIYVGALNNTDEALYLFDEKCVLRDKVVADPNWIAGDSSARKPMERGNDLGWHTLGSQNNTLQTMSNSGPAISGSPPLAPVAPKTYPKILISEVQIEGDGAKDEFVELFNPNNESVDLSGWKLMRKTSGGSDAYLVSSSGFSGTVGAYKYFLIVPQLNDDGTANYKGSAVSDLYYSGKTYSVAADNTVFLYNPNGQEVDRVGFGTSSYAEGTAPANPSSGSSLSRKYENSAYQDTDNNAQDFQVQGPSPKAVNPAPTPPPPPPPPPPAQDTTPPQATLQSLASSQSDVSLSLSWTAADPVGDVSPSGLQYIYVEYSVAPSVTGSFAQYNNNGVWTNWQIGSAGKLTLSPQTTSLSLRTQDGVSYTFQVTAKDVAGNTSTTSSAATAVTLLKTVVINEVAWMGTKASSSDEWVELYNASDEEIDLSEWSIYGADSGECLNFADADNFEAEGTNAQFLIAPGEYLVYGNGSDTVKDQSGNALVDVWDATIGLNNSSPGALQLYDQKDCVSAVVDEVNRAEGDWFAGRNENLGTAESPNWIRVSMERVDATKAGSDPANWAKNNIIKYNGRDAANNLINGTPGQANSTVTSPTTIEANIGLRFDEFSTITLTLLGSPYITVAGITVPAEKTLIVEPGVRVKFQDNAGYLTVQGTLKAQGTQESQIAFTVTDLGAVWCGIRVISPSTASQLDYVTIDKAQSLTGGGGCNQSFITYAMYVESSAVTINNSVIQTGSGHRKLYLKNSNSIINASTVSGATLNADSVGIYIDGGSPTISNSTISNNSIGIFVFGTATNPTITGNTFSGNIFPIKMSSNSAAFSENTAMNNTYNGIFMEGAVFTDTIWQKDNIPYIVNKFTVNAGFKLTIQAGVIVKFVNTPYADSGITVQGALVTQGTALNPVVFTGINDATTWKWIYLAPGSTGSQLTYTTLKYGGNTYYKAALYVKQSDIQFSNLTISNSAQSAIFSDSGTITGSGVTLSSNQYGFHMQGGNCPVFTDIPAITGGVAFHPSSFPSCSF